MLRNFLGGVGWGGDVDVRENLQHIRMLRNFLGVVGWGGDVDVRENLQHIRMLRNFLGWVGWGGDVDVRENLQHIRMLRISTRLQFDQAPTAETITGNYYLDSFNDRKAQQTKASFFFGISK